MKTFEKIVQVERNSRGSIDVPFFEQSSWTVRLRLVSYYFFPGAVLRNDLADLQTEINIKERFVIATFIPSLHSLVL